MGTNDIGRGASAEQVEANMKEIAARVRAKGMQISAATIIPRQSLVPGAADAGWGADKNAIRRKVNDWIRNAAGFDAVLDFDRVMTSAGDPDRINPAYHCGDGVHPAPIGYFEMGKSVDLGIFGAR